MPSFVTFQTASTIAGRPTPISDSPHQSELSLPPPQPMRAGHRDCATPGRARQAFSSHDPQPAPSRIAARRGSLTVALRALSAASDLAWYFWGGCT